VLAPYLSPGRGFLPDILHVSSPGASPVARSALTSRPASAGTAPRADALPETLAQSPEALSRAPEEAPAAMPETLDRAPETPGAAMPENPACAPEALACAPEATAAALKTLAPVLESPAAALETLSSIGDGTPVAHRDGPSAGEAESAKKPDVGSSRVLETAWDLSPTSALARIKPQEHAAKDGEQTERRQQQAAKHEPEAQALSLQERPAEGATISKDSPGDAAAPAAETQTKNDDRPGLSVAAASTVQLRTTSGAQEGEPPGRSSSGRGEQDESPDVAEGLTQDAAAVPIVLEDRRSDNSEVLELDRASEPAALAAARSGPLMVPPGNAGHPLGGAPDSGDVPRPGTVHDGAASAQPGDLTVRILASSAVYALQLTCSRSLSLPK
jgi:hypothetical protein